MTDLSPEVKHLLQTARESFSPTDERTSAVRRALAARLVAAADDSVGSAAGKHATWWSTSRSVGIGLIAAAFTTFAIMIGVHNATPARSVRSARSSETREWSAPAPARIDPRAAELVQPAVPPTGAPASASAQAPTHEAVAAARTPHVARAPLIDLRDAEVAAKATAPSHKHESAGAPLARETSAAAATARVVPSSHDAGDIAQPAVQTAASDDVANAPAEETHVPKPPLSTSTPTPDDSLGREVALLLRARAALAKHDPQAALALADQHASQFPKGRLLQERLAVRVLALCALGQLAQAHALTQELARIAPRSPHLTRIRMACPDAPKISPTLR
jgi:hypothetical protein